MAVAHKFIVADDHPLFRAALTQALRQLAPRLRLSKPTPWKPPLRSLIDILMLI